ncbi:MULTISPECIES: hypothetical protein [unclassified Methylobacterium]|uniref:hypothetical protein n=1 Tax=unclassified Methylobacterium TaxID=2615210 RepID=UPI0036FB797A
MAAYAVVETALARMHGADAEVQRGAFRGRLKHLQRLGLPLGDKPGKGRRIDYSEAQIVQLALALELSEAGLDPTKIVSFITSYWFMFFEKRLCGMSFYDTDYFGDILSISITAMSSGWKNPEDQMGDLSSTTWTHRTSPIDSLTSQDHRRFIVIDVGRMLSNLRKQIHLLEG